MRLTTRYRTGAARHWKEIFPWTLAAWGAMWTFTSSISALSKEARSILDGNGSLVLGGFVCAAIIWVLNKLPALEQVSFRLPGTNTCVDVLFGDVFEQKTHVAFAVGEYFDTSLGRLVSPNSVHGKFIQKYFQGDSARVGIAIHDALKVERSYKKPRRPELSDDAFLIGTTAAIPIHPEYGFLFAMTHCHPETDKASANPAMMLEGLAGLWRSVRSHSSGTTVSLPLIGAGQSGVGLSAQHLINLIVASLFKATQEQEVTKRVRIVLTEDLFDEVDLRLLKAQWA